jgi:hypothetical protein
MADIGAEMRSKSKRGLGDRPARSNGWKDADAYQLKIARREVESRTHSVMWLTSA